MGISQHPLKLALLECDTPVPVVKANHGTYLPIFLDFLRSSLPPSSRDLQFTLEGFDVVTAQEYPDLDNGEYKGVLISGSKYSAYDDDSWIRKLVDWVAETVERRPDVKIIGICFGHQIVARAMGGRCIPNDGKWEVGTTSFELTDEGKEVFSTDKSFMSIQQMHRDHVPEVPASFSNLGSSATCAVQGLIRRYPNTSDIHILTVQGHPEFTSDIVEAIIDAREASGAMSKEVVEDGRRRAVVEHDGIGAIGRAMWRVLGVDASEQS